ncbi:MAG: hypothetical protein FJ286_15880 [Planctomycetes bacterium]|nr:hypothetical protein [Planctomycetota bacterium]
MRSGGAAYLRQFTPVHEQTGPLPCSQNRLECRFEISAIYARKGRIGKHSLTDRVAGRLATEAGLDELPKMALERGDRV